MIQTLVVITTILLPVGCTVIHALWVRHKVSKIPKSVMMDWSREDVVHDANPTYAEDSFFA